MFCVVFKDREGIGQTKSNPYLGFHWVGDWTDNAAQIKMPITELRKAKAEMQMRYESGPRLTQRIDEHEHIYTVNKP